MIMTNTRLFLLKGQHSRRQGKISRKKVTENSLMGYVRNAIINEYFPVLSMKTSSLPSTEYTVTARELQTLFYFYLHATLQMEARLTFKDTKYESKNWLTSSSSCKTHPKWARGNVAK